jgi:hypothetical protein
MADESTWQKPRDEIEVHQLSPKYTLTIKTYAAAADEYWDVSRGFVTDESGRLLLDIKRNYSSFWHCFIHHPNGNDYLLCGEVYQGYNVINLTTGVNHAYVSEGAMNGFGFCWMQVTPSPDNRKILVHGCIWGFPYQMKVFDFSEPDQPLVEIFDDHAIFDDCGNAVWFSPNELVVTLTSGSTDELVAELKEAMTHRWTLSVNQNLPVDGKLNTVNFVIKM